MAKIGQCSRSLENREKGKGGNRARTTVCDSRFPDVKNVDFFAISSERFVPLCRFRPPLFRALGIAADGRDAHAPRAHAHEAGGRRLRGRSQAGQVVALPAVQPEVPRGQVQRAPARKQEPVRAGASPPIPPPTRERAATRAASRPLASAELESSRRCARMIHRGSRVSDSNAPRVARAPHRRRPVRSLVRDKTSPAARGSEATPGATRDRARARHAPRSFSREPARARLGDVAPARGVAPPLESAPLTTPSPSRFAVPRFLATAHRR